MRVYENSTHSSVNSDVARCICLKVETYSAATTSNVESFSALHAVQLRLGATSDSVLVLAWRGGRLGTRKRGGKRAQHSMLLC